MPLLSLLSLLSLLAGGLDEATDASVDRAGSWIEAWLPWRCCVYEATVDAADDGRERSCPMAGSGGRSSSMVDILKAGRSSACRIEGLRNDSRTCGRGRIEVARAEDVMSAG